MRIYTKNDFLRYMPDVLTCEERISSLNEQWDNLKLLCEINCPIQSKSILPSMTKIQKSFYYLQQELIDNLETEKLKKLEQKIKSKAQFAIDILIRNIQERSSDIGFIATDDDIRQFLCDKKKCEGSVETLRNRLNEYIAKYSVYDEIVILDENSNVLVNFDLSNKIVGKKIDDVILEKTKEENDHFVESFQPTALQPEKKKAHIFSSKIYKAETSQMIGIICLSFRFEDEINQILEKLSTDDGCVVAITDAENTVIASSDENHLPTGFTVESIEENIHGIVYYRGNAYIAKTVFTKERQKYTGLGWKAYVMLPLGLAFQENYNLDSIIDTEVARELMQMTDSFSESLNLIVDKTEIINNSLKRIVFNGQIIEKENIVLDEFVHLKPILSTIGKLGTKTSRLFQDAVSNLFSTVVTTSLAETSFKASLCVDVMDRNLYERANDCRWWALNSTFRRELAKTEIGIKGKEDLTGILNYINALYSVYSKLFIFDKSGKIVAVSNQNDNSEVGKILDSSFVSEILNNTKSKNYSVSPFEASELFNNQYTYIYGASITDISNNKRTVGGIGLVFDSTFQLKRMLADAIKDNGKAFAIFADRNKNIIATTNDSFEIGSNLSLPDEMFKMANGQSNSVIMFYENCYYAIGWACSSNYREYKKTDGYKNDCFAFVFEKLSEVEKLNSKVKGVPDIEFTEFNDLTIDEHKKIGVFVINNKIFGLDESIILEVIEGNGIVKFPGTEANVKGIVEYKGDYIVVLNAHELLNLNESNSCSGDKHILILKLSEKEKIGLYVDKLMSVLELGISEIKPVSFSPLFYGIVSLADNAEPPMLG